MTINQVIDVLITLTLIEMMAAIGLGVTVGDLAGVLKNWRLVVQAVVANYVCVPAITVGLLLLFQAHPLVSAGFLILAVCPGAPFGPRFVAVAKGDLTVAVGLMTLLAGSSAIIAPLLLPILLPLLSEGDLPGIDPAKILSALFLTQLLPLCVGGAMRHWLPGLAAWLLRPAVLLSQVLGLVVMIMILVVRFHLLAEVHLRAYLGMLLLLAASWAVGWLLGGPGRANRVTMTLTTSLRNIGVGLVIAADVFADTPAVTAVVVYGLFEIIGSLILALFLAKYGSVAAVKSA
jgi:BASS family bile acid:Na+ symporter